MRLLICGSRDFNDYELMVRSLAEFKPIQVISGMARGADALACRWAHEHGIALRAMPADWKRYGPRAGFIRNGEMVRDADAVVAFWDGHSRGTAHTISLAAAYRLPCKVVAWPAA